MVWDPNKYWYTLCATFDTPPTRLEHVEEDVPKVFELNSVQRLSHDINNHVFRGSVRDLGLVRI
jgi:hypothetical protein